MTDPEWVDCRKPQKLLRAVDRKLAGRKLQLLLCGVCRLVWHLIPDQRLREAILAAELFVDGELEATQFQAIQQQAMTEGIRERGIRTHDFEPQDMAAYVVQATLAFDLRYAIRAALEWGEAAMSLSVERRWRVGSRLAFQHGVCDLLRELYPPPSRDYRLLPMFTGGGLLLPDGSTFQIPEVAVAIGQGIQHDQAFDRMPILADALEDHGCTDRHWLDHLRHQPSHVRGCWALDLVLGRI